MQGIYLLLLKGISVDLADSQGNTALTSVRQLLDIQAYSEALHLTTILIQAGTNLNHVNHEDKTILSYSVTHGDASSDLTRLLLNHGAKVWPSFNLTDSSNSKKQQCEIVEHLTKEREQSAFTWFLKNVMEKYSLANMDKTIFLLSSSMGEDPARMQNHIMRVMMHYGHKSTKAFGPMFQEIKQRMSAFWTQPQPLRYLCLKQIRKSIGPKNLSDDECMQTLNVPNTMLQYLQLGK